MTIFLDTNVVPYKSGTSIRFETLLILAQECHQDVALPELVLRESVAHRQREIEGAFGTLRSAYEKVRVYVDEIVEPNLPSSQMLAESWERNLKQKVKILETPKNAFEDAIFREIQRIRPTREGRGARDAVIWLTVKQAHLFSATINYFVSENIKDFAAPERGNNLHEDLQQEIAEHPKPLIYCKSLDTLIKQIAKEIEPEIKITAKLLDSSEEVQKALCRAIQDNLILRETFPALPLGKEYISSAIIPSQYEVQRATTYQIGDRNVVVTEITCHASFTIGVLQQWSGGGFSTLQYPTELALFIRFWMRFENHAKLPTKAEISSFDIKSAMSKLS
jgi:hypothetical protein